MLCGDAGIRLCYLKAELSRALARVQPRCCGTALSAGMLKCSAMLGKTDVAGAPTFSGAASRVDSCRICGNGNFRPIINLGVQRLSGVFPTAESDGPSPAPLDLIRCDAQAQPGSCGLVQLRDSAAISEMYGTTYGYYSSLSPTMVSHLAWIVQQVVSLVDPKPGDVVLDIGCNDGTLLNLYEGRRLKRVGMDPSSRKFAHLFQPDIKVLYDFFSEEKLQPVIAAESARIITSIAMFYDVEDPLSFMRQVRSLLRRDGVWALELSYLPLMLTNLTYDQILHEHLLYLGLRQIQWMMDRSGLRLLDITFNEVNGGSIFIIAGRDDGPYPSQTARISQALEAEAPLQTDGPYDRFRNRVLAHRDQIREFLSLAAAAGKTVLGYGASTKGNVVLNYCGVGPDLLPAICDTNVEKYGLVTPGTKIPIISKEEARRRNPDYFFVLIWHFRKEVLVQERDFIAKGGKMAFDLPRLHFVNSESYERYLSRPLADLGYPL